MKVIILKEPGGTEQLRIIEMEIPTPGREEVLVQVRACSINPVDIKTRKGGALYGSLRESCVVILGWDLSGIVTAVGEGVKNFKEGDAVFGMVNFPGHGKAYAEYVAAPEGHLALKPEAVSHEEAAASTLAALTAWQVLTREAGLQKGQRLLMHAAAGGVGHFAVQMARHLGAEVWGTGSPSSEEWILGLGAHHFVDYTSGGFSEANDMDVVFDPVGGDTTARSVDLLKEGGVLISIVGGVKENLAGPISAKNIRAKNYLVHSRGGDMTTLAAMLAEGVLKPFVSHRFSFKEIDKAHQQMETGRTRGKVVVSGW